MALIKDGVTIPQTLNSLIVNDTEIYEAYCNGQLIWSVPEYKEPFWIKPSQTGTVLLDIKNTSGSIFPYKTLQYSFDAINWTSIALATLHSTGISVSANQKVYFSSTDVYPFYGSNNDHVVGLTADSTFSVGGNALSLFNYTSGYLPNYALYKLFYNDTNLTDASNLYLPSTGPYCFISMFEGCTNLTGAPHLPSLEVAFESCENMFKGCVSLTTPPMLPATKLMDVCYRDMFNGCTSLVQAPKLPATLVKNSCYYGMFFRCTSLVSCPELPATTLEKYCYFDMFSSCWSLVSPPVLPATTLADSCYLGMFSGCKALSCIPKLPATTLANSCYWQMFSSCTALKFSETQTAECPNAYRIPVSGSGTTATDWNSYMFNNTGGTFTGNPTIDTTYYTNATVV